MSCGFVAIVDRVSGSKINYMSVMLQKFVWV